VAPHRLIIDCDPGIDDAFALAFAHGHPALDLRGITTVAGNVGLDRTTANALAVRDYLGLPGVPVTQGCEGPLLRPPLSARSVHGASGLGEAKIPASLARPAEGHAVDYLGSAIGAEPGEITLVAIGPLTNVALALRRYPGLVSQVSDFVIMGGSAGRGNVTPAAEFNIAADPEAAAIVFGAGWTVTMIGLDVTLQARATAAVRDRMRTLGRLADDLLLPSLAGYRASRGPMPQPGGPHPTGRGNTGQGNTGQGNTGQPGGPPVHDVCAVAYVAAPGLITCAPARVEVETTGRWTAGMTVTDFSAAPQDCNTRVAVAIDTGAFWDVVLDAYERVAAGLPAAGTTQP
jgi:purine nucleosidase